jgi:MarR family transcriptional regulator, lower aerobic nicotinate degradation pathway regulator
MHVENAPKRLRSLPTWLLGQVSMEGQRVVGEVLAERGWSRGQYASMATLEEFGPLSQTALSDRSGLDPSDVVRWIDQLAEEGLVERTQDPDDRRRNAISITDSGRAELEAFDERLASSQDVFLRALSARERRELMLLLGRVLGLAPEL